MTAFWQQKISRIKGLFSDLEIIVKLFDRIWQRGKNYVGYHIFSFAIKTDQDAAGSLCQNDKEDQEDRSHKKMDL